jgi:two-component system sensor kinase FixL
MQTQRASSQTTETQVRQTAQHLARRYWLLLAAVAVLAMIDQAVVQPLLIRLYVHAPVINVAGRQRMLSQQLAKLALALQTTEDEPNLENRRRELQLTATQWADAHHSLATNDSEFDLAGGHSARISREFRRLHTHFAAMHSAAEQLAHVRSADGSVVPDPRARAPRSPASQVATILHHEAAYLPIMEGIVGLYEQEARRHVTWLRLVGLSIMVTVWLLLVALGVFVLRPANQMIEQQLVWLAASEANLSQARDELELRVTQRTRELQLRTTALQREMVERRRAESNTRELSAQLAHASRITALGQLATGLAHELNQPLAAITNYAETADLLLEERSNGLPAVRDALQRVRQTALRAGKLVERMRRFIRPTPLQRHPATIESLVREVCELCHAGMRDDKTTVRVEVEPNLPPLLVDSIQIQQVLMNLIQNALQAMRNPPVDNPQCMVRVVQDDHECRVEVHDNGPGFPDQATDTHFTPFFTTKPDGLGMGLAISGSIVQQHGGRLWATSVAGRGAIVGFVLPMANGPPAHENLEHASDRVCR